MHHRKNVSIILVIICNHFLSGVTGDVTLTSDLEGNVAYHRQRVTLVCTVTTDYETIINWRSPQYIGTGGRILQLMSTYSNGHTVSSTQIPTTVATLINTTRSNGRVTIISELKITALASELYSNSESRISCRANGMGEPVFITIWIYPPVILTHNLGRSRVAYDRQTVIFNGTINIVARSGITITWTSADYIGTGGDVLQLTSDDPLGTATNKSSTIATLINTTHSSSGLITAIVELRLTASVMYHTSSVSCTANGAPVRRVIFRTFQLPVIGTTVMEPRSDDNNITTDKNSIVDTTAVMLPLNLNPNTISIGNIVGGIIGGIIGIVLIALVVLVLSIAAIYYFHIQRNRTPCYKPQC